MQRKLIHTTKYDEKLFYDEKTGSLHFEFPGRISTIHFERYIMINPKRLKYNSQSDVTNYEIKRFYLVNTWNQDRKIEAVSISEILKKYA